MRTTWLAAGVQRSGFGPEAATWKHTVEREISRLQRLGLSKREIIEHVAERMYKEDMRQVGWLIDLGLFSRELYLEDAELLVDSLLPSTPRPPTRAEGGGVGK